MSPAAAMPVSKKPGRGKGGREASSGPKTRSQQPSRARTGSAKRTTRADGHRKSAAEVAAEGGPSEAGSGGVSGGSEMDLPLLDAVQTLVEKQKALMQIELEEAREESTLWKERYESLRASAKVRHV